MTLSERLCDPQRFEDALLEIKTTLDTVAGSSIVHEAFRALHAAIAERDGQIGALADVVKRYHEALPSPESTTVLANLPAAAKACDERLEAEGAAEALERYAKKMNTEASEPGKYSEQSSLDIGAWSETLLEEAARLREEAGR